MLHSLGGKIFIFPVDPEGKNPEYAGRYAVIFGFEK